MQNFKDYQPFTDKELLEMVSDYSEYPEEDIKNLKWKEVSHYEDGDYAVKEFTGTFTANGKAGEFKLTVTTWFDWQESYEREGVEISYIPADEEKNLIVKITIDKN